MLTARLAFPRSTVLLALLFGTVAVACGEGASQQEAELIAGCEGAKLDAKGVCRKPSGQFAKKVCCEAKCEPVVAPTYETTIVAGTNHTGERPRLVIDGAGATHVVYFDFENSGSKLRYARQDAAGNWIEETVANASNSRAFDLAVDGEGKPYVVQYLSGSFSSSLALYTRSSDGTWKQVATLASSSSASYPTGIDPSIAIGPTGTLHVAYRSQYFDTAASQFVEDIVYATSRTNWAPVVVDSVEVRARGPQILLDATERVRVAYATYSETTHSSVAGRVATLGRDGAWETVEGPATSAYALDQTGAVHAAYCDESDTLVYAKLGTDGWAAEPIDDDDGVVAANHIGCFPALAVDKSGYPHVGFQVVDPPDASGLWRAARGPNGWIVTHADVLLGPSDAIGNDIRIAVDASCPARASIAHYDLERNDLRLTVQD